MWDAGGVEKIRTRGGGYEDGGEVGYLCISVSCVNLTGDGEGALLSLPISPELGVVLVVHPVVDQCHRTPAQISFSFHAPLLM